ncbi:MAG TPA: AraC family transcriptional regulator [Polyangiales bacterium]|nr:AraC family transcriptional regulator [Polyangiales bacterium]
MAVSTADPYALEREPTVSARVVLQLMAAVERAGVSRVQFLQALNLPAARLEETDARVKRADLYAYCETALDVTADPAFGLHWAESVTSNTFNLVAQLLAHAATLRHAFQMLFKYGDLITDQLNLRLIEADDRVELRVDSARGAPPRVRRISAEMTTLGMLKMLRDFSPRAEIRAVNFSYAAPDYRSEYTRLFEGLERFEQPSTGIVFDRELMELASPYRDESLQRTLRELAERRAAAIRPRRSYVPRVREALLQHGMPHRVAMEKVADQLHLSLRSLHRRLADEGRPFSSIASEASAIVAQRMLGEEQRTIQETARAMGFRNVTSFHRAFKRWTGTTPRRSRTRP